MAARVIECGTGLLTMGLMTGLFCYCLLPRVRPPRDSGRLLLSLRRPLFCRLVYLILVVYFLGLAAASVLMIASTDTRPLVRGEFPTTFVVLVIVAPSLASVLLLGAAFHTIEIREQGVVVGNGRWLTRWRSVTYCQWTSRHGRLSIRRRRFVFPEWTRICARVPPDEIALVTRILARYVMMRDPDGRVIPPPDNPGEPPVPLEEPPARRSRFQLDLKTALLLFLVVASASGWFAMLRQRLTR
jgi:hypothetical protein